MCIDTIFASFQSAGKVPVCKERLIKWVRGADMLHAVSFSKPGGRLSIPVDLVRLMDFRSRSTSSFGTARNLNSFTILLRTDLGGLQAKPHSGMAFSRKLLTIVVKKVQKPLAPLIASFVFHPVRHKTVSMDLHLPWLAIWFQLLSKTHLGSYCFPLVGFYDLSILLF